jgi:hypothetical protein
VLSRSSAPCRLLLGRRQRGGRFGRQSTGTHGNCGNLPCSASDWRGHMRQIFLRCSLQQRQPLPGSRRLDDPCDHSKGHPSNSPRLFLGSRTSIGNNVQRTGNNSPPRSRRRIGLELGLARDTAHSFFARFQSPSARGGRHSMSTASSG